MILYRKFKDRIERNSFAGTCGWIIGGAKGYVGPPSQIIGGSWPPLAPPLPTPMFLNLTHYSILSVPGKLSDGQVKSTSPSSPLTMY